MIQRTPNPFNPDDMRSAIYRAPLAITGYVCVVCHRYHLKPSRKFQEHYAVNEKHYGWSPVPKTP